MAQKFSLLVSAAIAAAAVPPLLSYIPQTSSIFVENSTPSESTQSVPMPNSQSVPYSNSVNQLNDLNSQQQWQSSAGMVHQVGYTPTENETVQQTAPPAEYVSPAQTAPTQVTSTPAGSSQTATAVTVGAGTVAVGQTPPETYNPPVSRQTDTNGNSVQYQGIENTSLATRNSQLATQTNQTELESWFRFDITQQWIEQHWGFVTACVGPMQLQGYRVTLVTGPKPDDLTGVITYYFDSRKQLQQIQFQGTTGHLGRLTTMLNTQFHMSQRIVNDPAITIYETPANLHGSKNYMEARSPMVIKSDQVYHRYEVFLLLNRPAEKQGLLW